MPALTYGLSSYKRTEGDLPELPVVNLYAEEAPTEGRGIMLQSRPGLETVATLGSGPVRQMFKRDLVVSSAVLAVSGSTLYSNDAAIGTILGSGFVSIAGNEIGAMVTAGSRLYFYNGSALSTVAFPDNSSVSHVTVGGSRYWLVRKDTGKLYFTAALESNVNALDFLTAESLPDRLLQTLWVDGGLIAFGSESVEFFQQTGDPELPITPLTNMVFECGVKATGCATNIGTTFAFVTSFNQVAYQSDSTIISTPGLEKRIEQSTACRLFAFQMGGDEFLALRIDNETQVWNKRTGMWSEFASYGEANWLPQCFAAGYFGSAVDGQTFSFGDGYTDLGGPLERRFRAGVPIEEGTLPISNLRVRANVGNTPYLTGDYAEPHLEMRLSLDAGRLWSNWRSASLGMQGDYRKQPEWRSLGMAAYPGFLAEFRVTDPVDFRVSDVQINGAWGGR